MFRKLTVLGVAACLPACLLADFSYDQTSKVTGGALAGLMKFAGAFSKQAREPIQATVAVKGNRMLHWNKNHASVINLDAETITEINFQRKTYSVITFAQMKQMMEQMSQQMSESKSKSDSSDVKTDFKLDVKDTGQTKQIGSLEAKERILTMSMESTDPQTGNQGTMQVVNDMWITPQVPGSDELREFHKKMAAKLAWSPDSNALTMGRPDLARAMATAAKEAGKLDGMPVLTVTKFSGVGQPGPGQGGAQTSDSAQQTPQPQQQAQQPAKPSLGDALSGKLGGFGGFGRKKKAQQQDPPADASQSTPAPAAGGDSSGSLMEITSEMSNFSSAAVDPSRFDVPSGFKQVEPEMNRKAPARRER